MKQRIKVLAQGVDKKDLATSACCTSGGGSKMIK
jgi:hypothetical protein